MPWKSASPQGVLMSAAFEVPGGAWPVTDTSAHCRSKNTTRITASTPMISKNRLVISHSPRQLNLGVQHVYTPAKQNRNPGDAHEPLASGNRWHVHESGTRLFVCVERVRAAPGKRIQVDARSNLVGFYNRYCDVCGNVRPGRPHSGQAWSSSMCIGWGDPGLARVLCRQHDNVAALSIRGIWCSCRRRQWIRLRDSDSGSVEMVPGQKRIGCWLDGGRLRSQFRD